MVMATAPCIGAMTYIFVIVVVRQNFKKVGGSYKVRTWTDHMRISELAEMHISTSALLLLTYEAEFAFIERLLTLQ